MTARITAFDTRAEIGLVPPRSVSKDIQPGKGGSAVHYGGGGALGILESTSHDRCRAVLRSWQNYHMGTQGWADLAYTGAYCVHGYAMAGRGFGVRTAANGTADANDRFLAFVFVGNAGDPVTIKALDALDWWLAEARRAGGAGLLVKPHSFLYSTSCPGDALRVHAALRDGKTIPLPAQPTPAPTPTPTPTPTPVPVLKKRAPRDLPIIRRGALGTLVTIVQRIVDVFPDGIYGADTEAAVKRFQAARGLGDDGVVGPLTGRALLGAHGLLSQGDNNDSVRLLQWLGSVGSDGDFGPNTHTATVEMQRWAGLEDDGVVGPATRAKIVF